MPPRLLVRLEVAQAAVEGGEPSAEAALESLFPNQWKLQGGQYRLGGHRVVHAAAADGAAAAAAALLEEPPAVRPAAAGRGVHIPFVVQPQGSPGQPSPQQRCARCASSWTAASSCAAYRPTTDATAWDGTRACSSR